MKRILLGAAAVAAVVSLAACNRGDNTGASGSVSDTPGQNPAVNAAQDAMSGPVGQASASTAGQTTEGYVNAAAIGDMYEIEAGKMAQQKGSKAEVKALGAMLVKDHTAMSNEMKAALPGSGANATPPTTLDERRQGMIDNLKTPTGADFDTAFLAQQATAHEEALTLHRGYSENGDNAALKALAGKATPKIQAHLDRVKKLQGGNAQ
jgi:putative membrane protein